MPPKKTAMQNHLLLLACLIALLALASCTNINSGSKSASQTDDFRKGTTGVTAQFQQTFGKEIVVSGDEPAQIDFLLALKNEGSYPENAGAQGAIWLSGFDKSIISVEADGYATFGPEPFGPLYLEGKSAANPQGGSGIQEFHGTISSKSLREGKYKATVLANVCYHYSTIANPAVCIEKNPFEFSNQKKACTSQDITLSGQGAPIAITKIEQFSTSDRIRFKITVKNAGKGIVADPALSCSPQGIAGMQRYQLNILSVDGVMIADKRLDCANSLQGGYQLRLIEGVGSFTCSIAKEELASNAAAFTTPLDITLTYLYRDFAETPIIINKIP